MRFKVLVHKADKNATETDSFVFERDRVSIGRDAGNDVPLNDPKRVVSKFHAEIVREGDTFQVKDLGSKNFTFLNGERLDSGQPVTLQMGDTIRVGDFELRLEVSAPEPFPQPPSPDMDQTVFAASFVNPFEDDVKVLAASIRSIGNLYEEVAASRRDDALLEALEEALGHRPAVGGLIARVLGGEDASSTASFSRPSFDAPPPAEKPRTPGVWPAAPPPEEAPPGKAPAEDVPFMATIPSMGPFASQRPPAQPPPSRPSPPRPTPPQQRPPPPPSQASTPGTAGVPRLQRLVDVLLRSVAKLIGVPWQFRYEFIGQTIVQPEETAFLFEGDAESIRAKLLNPALSEDEAARLIGFLQDAIEDVVLHQVALLDGYKAGVQQGAQRLLDQISPEAMEAEVQKEKSAMRLVPSLVQAEAFRRLSDKLRELRAEDWTSGERRTYRPAFIKAYLARMTSRRPTDKP